MEIIDNVNKTLKEDLTTEIHKGSKVSIAAACFSIYALSLIHISTMRLSRNMRKQRIRATKRLGRVPRNIMEIPIKRRTKRQRPFDN